MSDVAVARCPSPHLVPARCLSCIAQRLATMSLARAELAADQGLVPPAALEAYRHVWAISAVRSAAYDHWRTAPQDPEAEVFAVLLRRIRGLT